MHLDPSVYNIIGLVIIAGLAVSGFWLGFTRNPQMIEVLLAVILFAFLGIYVMATGLYDGKEVQRMLLFYVAVYGSWTALCWLLGRTIGTVVRRRG